MQVHTEEDNVMKDGGTELLTCLSHTVEEIEAFMAESANPSGSEGQTEIFNDISSTEKDNFFFLFLVDVVIEEKGEEGEEEESKVFIINIYICW